MIFSQLRIEVRLNLQDVSDRFKLYTIESSCRLMDAAPVKDAGDFKRGYAYYEFIYEKENIAEGKEIILMCEVVNFIAQDMVTVSFIIYRMEELDIFSLLDLMLHLILLGTIDCSVMELKDRIWTITLSLSRVLDQEQDTFPLVVDYSTIRLLS